MYITTKPDEKDILAIAEKAGYNSEIRVNNGVRTIIIREIKGK